MSNYKIIVSTCSTSLAVLCGHAEAAIAHVLAMRLLHSLYHNPLHVRKCLFATHKQKISQEKAGRIYAI